MIKIDILTLFPNMYKGFLEESIINKAQTLKKVVITIHNIRDYASNKHKQVDDYPFGGGSGMILMCEPIFKAIGQLKTKNTKVIMMTPSGSLFNQTLAYELSKEKHIIIICGHYEGFDERIRTLVDLEISIGDYVLTGGELPSMIVTDTIVRLIKGVINEASLQDESFKEGLLDYPNYTKPRDFKGLVVPAVLLSGDHKKIRQWRLEAQLKKTKEKRPDLLEK